MSWDAWPIGAMSMSTTEDRAWMSYLNGKLYIMPVSPWFYTNLNKFNKNWVCVTAAASGSGIHAAERSDVGTTTLRLPNRARDRRRGHRESSDFGTTTLRLLNRARDRRKVAARGSDVGTTSFDPRTT
ncbi:glycosyl hydrolase family 71-domain-containing protein [Aspergillus granulosus]|uniref:Glycosyl hydrolase family 71-domain-containing protein n=1 Tax=Aspergillus granulosus TaxID=176169 RepID=A0ABR4GUJ4_9EURO